MLKISEAQLKDAEVLYNSKRYDGVIYLCGYSAEGIMKKFIEKMVALEQTISAVKGDFVFFALFLREDAQGKWDLVV